MAGDSLKFLKEEAARLTQENHDLRQELTGLRQAARALSSLYYISQQITPQVDVLALLGHILDSALLGLSAADGSLMLVDDETGDLVFSVVRGDVSGRLEGYRLPKGKGIAGWVAQHRQPQAVRDVRRDPRFYAQVDEAFGFNTRSMVCVPVYLDDGRLLGVIEVLNKVSDKEFTQDDMDLLLIISQLAATAMRRAERAIEASEREKRRAALIHSGPAK
jgi:sigma-B regulation protein RsbU (phosphoserine phosphatase)